MLHTLHVYIMARVLPDVVVVPGMSLKPLGVVEDDVDVDVVVISCFDESLSSYLLLLFLSSWRMMGEMWNDLLEIA